MKIYEIQVLETSNAPATLADRCIISADNTGDAARRYADLFQGNPHHGFLQDDSLVFTEELRQAILRVVNYTERAEERDNSERAGDRAFILRTLGQK